MSKTRESGEQAVVQLGFLPDETAVGEDEDTSSCKDGFGFDDEGITRDQPSATWRLHFDSRADYRASVEDLRRAWTASGLTVEDIPAPGKGEPGEGMPGIKTSDDAGIELSFGPAWLSGDPELVADGGCVRHRYY
ncbi:hypothetical protein ACLB9X_22460 [Streptomyces sp. 5K101]|uniref:hypothetical protein n=1 Tax=Streptomyces sp. 5K101 TaxID=3390037 RepID=UPI00397625E9